MQQLEEWKVSDLIEYARNPRKNDHAVDKVAAAIREFGFRVPILAKSDKTVVDGHLRLKAAKKLGLETVPVILCDDMSEAQIKAFRISVNRVAEFAEWDNELLRIEFDALKELDFDLELTGFSLDEIDGLEIEEIAPEYEEDADGEIIEPPPEPKTKEGDVWVLGKHRLMCGDSTSIDAVERLLDGAKIDLVFTDPPYGISIVGSNGHVGGGGLAKVNTYAPIAGDDTIDVAIEAIHIIKTLGAKVEIIWGGNYYANHLNNSSCWIVWDKQNTGNFADCELAWTNQDTAVRMFSHMWNGMIKASEHGQKRVHPTQKPVALAEWCIENYGKDCETILDLFGGSGFTLIASEKKDKSSFTMELSPHYCDVIINRWQTLTGKEAILESTGETYNETAL